MMIIWGGKVLDASFTFADRDVAIDGTAIEGLYASAGRPGSRAEDTIDATGCYVVPGFIDIHTHGCDACDAGDGSYQSLNTMSKYYAAHGVTTFLATTSTISFEALEQAAKSVKQAIEQGTDGANVGGMHMEGPYFSYAFKGAQNPAYLRDPSVEEFDSINAASGGNVRLISLAPERDGALEFIRAVKDRVAVAMGHTDADYERAKAAIDAGATVLTHTFNAMRPLKHREPNTIGAALEDDRVFCESITDGVHLHPAIIRLLYRMVGPDRMMLISDSLCAAGMADGQYELGGLQFHVKNGRATLPDGTIAGSTANLHLCVKKVVEFGIPLECAIQLASWNPARAVGLDTITGRIEPGKRADLLLLDEKTLDIRCVIVNGRCIGEKR